MHSTHRPCLWDCGRRKWHEESSSAALSDVGMDPVWLTQRWRQQCETLRHLDSRVAWLEGERQRLTKEAAVEKEARRREARRAEEVEAREREKEAEERGLARQELDEVGRRPIYGQSYEIS